VRRERWIWLLVLLTVATYLPSLPAVFQFDDWNVIVDNAHVQSLHAWWVSMPGIRPLLKLSYALNAELNRWVPLGPTGFRLFNVLVHAANVLLAYKILTHFAARASGYARTYGLAAALIATALFALHPVQTESVTYISGRSNSLTALFVLLAVLTWQRTAESDRPWRWQLLSAVCFALAAATKETAVVAPLAMWLLYACTRSAAADRVQAPWGPTLALAGVATLIATSHTYGALLSYSLSTRNVLDNLLLAQPQSIVYLVGQLWRLDRLNSDPLLIEPAEFDLAALVRLSLLAGCLLFGLASIRRRPALSFGILWFFVWLAPTNSLLARIDLVNDRQLYLAILGPAWLVGLALARLFTSWRSSRSMVVLASISVAALAISTVHRNRVYVDETAFWLDVARKSPANSRAHNNLGIAYARQCQNGDALAAFQHAVAFDTDDYVAAANIEMLKLGKLASPGVSCEQ
jgi:protein O-mannosyl-transferase